MREYGNVSFGFVIVSVEGSSFWGLRLLAPGSGV